MSKNEKKKNQKRMILIGLLGFLTGIILHELIRRIFQG